MHRITTLSCNAIYRVKGDANILATIGFFYVVPHSKLIQGEKSLFCFRTMYLLGYIPKDNRLYLGDKELNIVSYSLLVSVLEYQTAVMRRDFGMADKVLPTIPKEQRTRVAHFLEKQARELFLRHQKSNQLIICN